MKKLIMSIALAALAALPLTPIHAQTEQSEKHRVVFEVTMAGAEQWNAVLNNVENLRNALGAATEIEVVAHSKGLGMMVAKDNPLPANTLIWTAGVTPEPVLKTLPCKTEKGRLSVNETLAVPDSPGVWAIGDCAWCIEKTTGKPYPPTAQHAIRQGKVAAQNIAASLRGAALRPYRYRAIGQLAVIGKLTGVAHVFGLQFSGFIAFALLALRLPDETPAAGEEAARRSRLDAGSLFSQGSRPDRHPA